MSERYTGRVVPGRGTSIDALDPRPSTTRRVSGSGSPYGDERDRHPAPDHRRRPFPVRNGPALANRTFAIPPGGPEDFHAHVDERMLPVVVAGLLVERPGSAG